MINYIFNYVLFCVSLSLNLFATSPTLVFLEHHPSNVIHYVLRQYDATSKDDQLFEKLIQNEDDSFIGYHAGSSNYMLFQDIIKTVIKEKLDIPVRDDFHFLRVPGNPNLTYPSADSFINQFLRNYPLFNDNRPDTRIHILSLNTNLYQSYDLPWDLTPRYYLENKPWTNPDFWDYLEEFFTKSGLDSEQVRSVVEEVLQYIPQNRGMIMQFFDPTADHSFLDTHFYVSHSGGNPVEGWKPAQFLRNPLINKQLRLVIDNKHILNPFGQLKIERYDSMTKRQRAAYHRALTKAIRRLAIDALRSHAFRAELMDHWRSGEQASNEMQDNS